MSTSREDKEFCERVLNKVDDKLFPGPESLLEETVKSILEDAVLPSLLVQSVTRNPVSVNKVIMINETEYGTIRNRGITSAQWKAAARAIAVYLTPVKGTKVFCDGGGQLCWPLYHLKNVSI